MNARFKLFNMLFCFAFLLNTPFIYAEEGEGERKLEEVVVYGQKVEMSVSDTSIAITALDENFLKDMGVMGPNEMVNFIPATTRTDWDIKIRGVGRNFRGLGGDPGVGTYYNGIYSSDFGIAATESGLYDIQRIEVLRGPQGTLYGRNSIGGVLNYVTNQPNHDVFEAQARVMLGQYDTNEYFGFLSGPVNDSLAYRLTGVKRKRDGAVDGLAGSEDVEGVNDQNIALILDWEASDTVKVNMRVNDRRSRRAGNFGNGGHGITSEGPCIGVHPIDDESDCDPRYRVSRDTNHYAHGFRGVDEAWYNTYGDLATNPLGAAPWINPVTGEIAYGAYNRPGVDNTNSWPNMPSANYQSASVASYDIGDSDAPDIVALTNNSAWETFDHSAASLVVDWDISDTLSIRYLMGYQDFEYYFNRDNDFSDSFVSDNNDTVIAQTDSLSHELRIFWELGDRWTATTGLYYFIEKRDQWYGIRERAAQGRVINPVNYGTDEHPNWLLDALALVGWVPGDEIAQTGTAQCFNWREAVINGAQTVNPGGGYGIYCGDEGTNLSRYSDTGALYEHQNIIETDNRAFYTQGDLKLSEDLSVTLGVRYSKDHRDGFEQRGGYSELNANNMGWLPWAIQTVMNGSETVGPLDFYGAGVTPLAAMNVAMGAAFFTGNPDFPIQPTCAFTQVECAHPLRLEGVPISWGHRTTGSLDPDADLTWRVNFNWEPTDDILLYFGATSGYRAGGWNMGGPENRTVVDTDGTGACDASFAGAVSDGALDDGCDLRVLLGFEGEEITSYELGYKGTHLDGTLQLNFALYYYDYKNYQDHVEKWEEESGDFTLPNITVPGGGALTPPAGRGPVSVTTNIANAVNKGFEVDALYLVNEAFTLGGNASYTISEYDAPYTFFNEDDPRYPRAVFGGDLNENPCNMSAELKALYCLEIEGYQLQGIPKVKASMWASYAWFTDPGSFTAYLAYSYTGDYSTHAFDRPWDRVPTRDRLDLRVTFRDQAGRWNASIFVDNVLDNTYIRGADMDNRRTGYGPNWPQRVIALYPRYWGVEATYNFGG